LVPIARFAARLPGRASGLALAVRPAGRQVSGVKGGRLRPSPCDATEGSLTTRPNLRLARPGQLPAPATGQDSLQVLDEATDQLMRLTHRPVTLLDSWDRWPAGMRLVRNQLGALLVADGLGLRRNGVALVVHPRTADVPGG
jgi:hypothetical protein